jgi:hypothetical protein
MTDVSSTEGKLRNRFVDDDVRQKRRFFISLLQTYHFCRGESQAIKGTFCESASQERPVHLLKK